MSVTVSREDVANSLSALLMTSESFSDITKNGEYETGYQHGFNSALKSVATVIGIEFYIPTRLVSRRENDEKLP